MLSEKSKKLLAELEAEKTPIEKELTRLRKEYDKRFGERAEWDSWYFGNIPEAMVEGLKRCLKEGKPCQDVFDDWEVMDYDLVSK